MFTKCSNNLWVVTSKYLGTNAVTGLYRVTKCRASSSILGLIPSRISLPFHLATPQISVGLTRYRRPCMDPDHSLLSCAWFMLLRKWAYVQKTTFILKLLHFPWVCFVSGGHGFPTPQWQKKKKKSEFFPYIYFNETLLTGLNYMNSNTSFCSTYTDSNNSRQH